MTSCVDAAAEQQSRLAEANALSPHTVLARPMYFAVRRNTDDVPEPNSAA